MDRDVTRLEALRLAAHGREGWTADQIIAEAEKLAGYMLNPEITVIEAAIMRERNESAIGKAMRRLAERPVPEVRTLQIEEAHDLIECQPGTCSPAVDVVGPQSEREIPF
jgi:hypothetical protein